MNTRSSSFAVLFSVILFVIGCGGGSGSATSENPVTTAPTASNYSGPAPATADVQAFKLNVWDNLVPNNRCGSCHNETQSPRFVRADDINLAYDATNPLVNLQDPAQSLLVNKVRGGHNCWLTDNNACGDILQSYIESWAGDSLGGAGKSIQLVAPELKDPGDSKNFPDSTTAFEAMVYPLLTQYCSDCHTDSAAVPQSPFFASGDVSTAYDAAQSRIDLDNPASSRLVLRLRNEFHNCWTDCGSNANDMEAAITAFADSIDPTEIDPDLLTSKALNLTDGIISSAGGRHETNVIALYEFKTGSGNTVFDTSGVEPALNLTISGDYSWVGGWGVAFVDGKAQGSTTASAKLQNLITATNEYSIEAWVVPGNVTQDGPARIATYSGGSDNRNFMIGQTLYAYDAFNRSDQSDNSGQPQLSTDADEEDLQATLQHVVVTFDPTNGRQIYVNGQYTDDLDSVPGGLLNEWNDTYAFALASEVDNNNRWAGTIRLMAVHNRALTPGQIQQNFDVGVGEKYFLLFNVSDHINIDDAYVVFEVSQFDSYGYLFDEPFFTILDSSVTPGTIPVRNIRIGQNGREVPVGQAFSTLNMSITDAAYTAADNLLPLSSLGTVVALEKGPALDEFFLTFELLGSAVNVVTESLPLPLPPPADVLRDPLVGIRNFAEINASMAKMTNIPIGSKQSVSDTYALVFQAMPVQPKIAGFISSQQMGVTQLAISYCSALVDDATLAAAYFQGFNFNATAAAGFGNRNQVIDPLIANMIGSNLSTQPDTVALAVEVNFLIDRLIACNPGLQTCTSANVVKAACASVLGSAAMLVQ